MNLGHGLFVVNGDSVTRLSQKSFNDFFVRHLPALPAYAGTTVVLAMAIYELKNRKPERVVRIDVRRFKVDWQGSMDREHFGEGMQLDMDNAFARGGKAAPVSTTSTVVDASGIFEERRWRQHHPEIAGPALKLVLADLFGATPSR